MKKWVTKKIDKNLAKKLAEECDVDPFVAMIPQLLNLTKMPLVSTRVLWLAMKLLI